MSDENSDDELPSISLSQDTSVRDVIMPSAKDIAAARAREMHTELELQRLREQHSPPPSDGVIVPHPLRSDSSGSEGEAQLAQAVRALRVLPAPPPRAAHLSTARRLLNLLPATSQAALENYISDFAEDASPVQLKKKTEQIVMALSCVLNCENNVWSEEELLTCCGVLSAACLAAASPLVRRAFHKSMTFVTSMGHSNIPARIAELTSRAAVAGPGGRLDAARALLALSDCARGGSPSSELLAALLVRRGLTLILAPHMADQECTEPLTAEQLTDLLTSGRGWKGVEVEARQTVLRLAGRSLATARGRGGATEALSRALAVLAQPPTASDKQHPDYLKVVVAGSTLQLLFRPQP